MADYEPTSSESAEMVDEIACEITGNIFPVDEIVDFQGKRVSAQGKQILMDKLAAGEAMPGELERPGAFRRFACMFLDGIILGIAGAIVGAVLGVLMSGLLLNSEPGDSSFDLFQGIMQLAGSMINIAYYTFFHGSYGQTLGKMAGKVKVVNADGTDINMSTAFKRTLYLVGPNLIGVVVILATLGLDMEIRATLTMGVGVLIMIYFVVSIIMALVDRDQQRAIHDRLAKTRVIALD